MTLRALLTRASLFSILALASGCDSNGPDEDDAGSFDARVSGTHTQALDGTALFETGTEDGQTATAIALADEDETDSPDLLLLVLEGAPRTGTFTVDSEAAGGLLVLSDGDGDGEDGDLYASSGGSVTITRTSSGRLEGRFDLDAVNVIDPEDMVSVEGTFDAARGEVAEPARPARADA